MSNELTIRRDSQREAAIEIRRNTVKYPRLCKMEKGTAINEIAQTVVKAFLYRGQPCDQTNAQFIASALYDELVSETKYGACFITTAEIERVVKAAVLGETELYGINVSSLYRVILEWVKGEGHLLQKETEERKRLEDDRTIRESVVGSIIGAQAGELLRKSSTLNIQNNE